jgi:type IV pilus assembly protein PilQ
LTVGLAGALATASGPEAGVAAPAGASIRLKSIVSHVGRSGTSLVIEATEPMPYVATRPDPLTLYIDFRNVATDGFKSKVATSPKTPIADVAVEPGDAVTATSSRIRVSLVEPVAHRVRSERNTIVVEFDTAGKRAAPPPVVSTSRVQDPIAVLGLDQASPTPRGEAAAQGPAIATAQAAPTASPLPGGSPQAPAQAEAPAPGAPAGGERRFTGHPVSLDFQGADLRAVLRTFAEISGLNVVIDPAVSGSVDVALRDVPWDQALDIILRANKLGYMVDGTIVRIAPLTVLSEEEQQRRKLAEDQALAGELRVLTKTLSYAKAEELQELLTRSALSQRGTVQFDTRTNTLIITDLADRLNTAAELINTLDRPQPQVEIEARIVQTTKNYARELGVQWGFAGRVDPTLGNTTGLAFPNSGAITGRLGGAVDPAPTGVNLPVEKATSAVGIALGSVNGAFNLDVALSALEKSGQIRLLSTPRVSTQNNVEAEITQGTQIPIQTIANNTVTVSFKDAALTLKVTPQITASNTVIMRIFMENAVPDFGNAAGPAQIPPILTQRAQTSVLVSDGETTVIAGIYKSSQSANSEGVPGLSRIPLLSWLFKREVMNDDSSELLIFITPRILKS